MKILIVTTGGVTRFFRNWPEVLLAKALVKRGHQVTAFTYYDPGSDALNTRAENIDGVCVKRIAPRGWYSRELARALANERADVLHIFHLRNYLAFQSAWTMRRMNVPFVVTPIGPLHDDYLVADRDRPLDVPPRWENLIWSRTAILNRVARDGRVKRHVENYLMHWPVRHANAVIASSNHERELWKHAEIESETIPLWIDEEFVRGLAGEKYATEFAHPVILFVAQLKYRKGFDILARAMPRVTAQFPNATFVFVSHSPIHRRELERLADETNTRANLKIIEQVNEADKVRLYNSADMLAFPTRYEGFGLPLLEAMAAGCPVVASDIPVVDEIVTNGENGLLTPREDAHALGDAIGRVIQDRALREKFIVNGFETLKRFRENDLVARIEDVYARVTSFKSQTASRA